MVPFQRDRYYIQQFLIAVASHEDDRNGIVRFDQLGLEVEAAQFGQPMVAKPRDSMRDVIETRESSSSSIRIWARKTGLCGHGRTAGRGSIRISDGIEPPNKNGAKGMLSPLDGWQGGPDLWVVEYDRRES